MTVPQERVAQANLKLRCLEDEGLYVQDRPKVPWWVANKMSNRLIEQDKVNPSRFNINILFNALHPLTMIQYDSLMTH